ncbi:hypothetical protein PSHT_07041, partial [Puccinia striiformis]
FKFDSNQKKPQHSVCVILKGFPYSTTETNIQVRLRELGVQPDRIIICMDEQQHSRRFGFVTFPNVEAASQLVDTHFPGILLRIMHIKSKPEEKPAVAIDEGSPALAKFLSNPQAYVSYISPQLLLDGSNISQWPDSLEDLALLVFGICKFCLEESNFMLLSATMDRSLTHVIKNSISKRHSDMEPHISKKQRASPTQGGTAAGPSTIRLIPPAPSSPRPIAAAHSNRLPSRDVDAVNQTRYPCQDCRINYPSEEKLANHLTKSSHKVTHPISSLSVMIYLKLTPIFSCYQEKVESNNSKGKARGKANNLIQ